MSISSHRFGTKTVTFQEDKYFPVHILKMNQPSYGLKWVFLTNSNSLSKRVFMSSQINITGGGTSPTNFSQKSVNAKLHIVLKR